LGQKKLEEDFGTKLMFWDNYRPNSGYFRTFYAFVKFKKLGISSIFGQIEASFFFQNAILGKISHRIIKNGFSDIV
jgi:hypothetical protein